MESKRADVAVIGGGIVGLAHALAAAKAGNSVVLFERSGHAVGASVRNFGLLWPVGQPEGSRHRRALRSREIWSEVARAAGLYLAETGSLHLAYRADEWDLLREFAATTVGAGHGRSLLDAAEVRQRSPVANPLGLIGAFWSPTEATVDPREAIRELPRWLAAAHGVQFQFGTTVRGIDLPTIETTAGTWRADCAIVCSGQDFETLYPEVFARADITRCKLQMMRTVPQPAGWQLGPSICGGLTLTHYDSFKGCRALGALRARLERDFPFHATHGIHVLVSQTAAGELTLGDSHHYGPTVEPFDREEINEAILAYFRGFAVTPRLDIAERWHGIYPKMKSGASELVTTPRTGVRIVNGLGGAGMTLAFGLAEEVVATL
jgi:FAD dependent oxidoreductase TIGR03364